MTRAVRSRARERPSRPLTKCGSPQHRRRRRARGCHGAGLDVRCQRAVDAGSGSRRAHPGRHRARRCLRHLLRRDPARRRAQRVRGQEQGGAEPGDAGFLPGRPTCADVAERRPGFGARWLGSGRRQPHRHAARHSARGSAGPGRGYRGPRRRLHQGQHRLASGRRDHRRTMQFHGTADRWSVAGAATLATLYSDADSATSSPAVTLRNVGGAGGQTAAFTYDLAHSIVGTRQGDIDLAGLEHDGQLEARSAATSCSGRADSWTSTRSRSRRPTSSSGCWPTSSRR